MSTVPPNNNTGLYGIDGSAVSISNDVTVDNLAATGNISAGGNLAVGNNATIGGNLTVTGTIFGNITGNLVVPGSNTQVLFNNDGNAGASADLTFNDNTNVLDVNGNVSANYFIGDGSQLTGLPASYGNSNVVTLLASYGSNTISTTGNITGGYILGNGSQLTGLPATYGNANVAAYLPTYTGNLAGGNANITTTLATGTIRTDNYQYANGTPISFAGTYGNSNVTTLLASFGSNTISTTGNVTAGYFSGDGSLLTNINAGNISGSYGNANVAAYLPTYTGNIAAGNLTAATTTVTGNLSIGGNINTFGSEIVTLEANSDISIGTYGPGNGIQVTGPGIFGVANLTGTIATFTGNVTGGNIIGNGQYLTNLPGANVTGTVANATYATSAGSATTATSALTANTVTNATQANITSVGTLTGLTVGGDADITGNLIVGQNLVVNGNTTSINITELNVEDPIISQGRGANNAPLTTNDGKDRGEQFWYYSGTEKSAFSGYDNSAGKMLLATDVSIANEIVTVNSLGNIVGGNIEATSVVTSGNVTASYVSGNGSQLSSLTGANVTGTVPLATSATTAGTVTTAAQPNITSVGTLSSLAVTGNITGGNVNSTFYGSGAGLSSLTGANVTGVVAQSTQANYANTANAVAGGNVSGQVANALVAGTVYTAAQPNITSVGTLTSLAVTGNITGGNVIATHYGSGAGLSSLTGANVTGTVANATYATSAGSASTATSALTAGTVTTAAQPNITSVGTLTSLSVSGNIVATGNITGNTLITSGTGGDITGVNHAYANYVIANTSVTSNGPITAGAVTYANTDGTAGQVLTTYGNGITYWNTAATSTYGDSNVNTLLAAWGSNTLSTTGNVTAGYFIGNGSTLTNLTGANVTGTVANATYATSAGSATTATTATSATTAGTVTTAAQPNITSVGTLSSLAVTGNTTTGNILTDGYYYANGTPFTGGGGGSYGDANVTTLLASLGSNAISSTANITTTGNVTGANLLTSGNIYGNTAKIYTDVNGFAAYGSQNPASGGYVTNGAGNILIGGHPTLGVALITKYNEAGQRVMTWDQGYLNLNPLSAGAGNIVGVYDIVAGNAILSTGNIFTYGTFSGATVSAVGNITGGNLISGSLTYTPTDGTAGQVLTTYGNGKTYFSTVSGGSYGDSNVATFLAAFGSNTINTTGDLSTGNVSIAVGKSLTVDTISAPTGSFVTLEGVISTNGIQTSGNISNPISDTVTINDHLSVAGNTTATGNISGSYFLGNGSQLTGLPATYNDSNVNTLLASWGSNTLSTTGNITVGNIANTNGVWFNGSDGLDARINTNTTWAPNSASNTTPAPGRILVGSGYNGNTSYQYDVNGGARTGRLVVLDSGSMGDTQQRLSGTYTQIAATATANITNGNTRFAAGINQLVIGGGSAGNTINTNIMSAVTGGFNSVIVGTSGNLAVGNTQLGHVVGQAAFVLPQTGSTVGNAVGVLGQIITQGTGNVTNGIGAVVTLPNTATGNAIAYYMPGTTNYYGVSIGSTVASRQLANYYFVKTDDPSAKSDLGALNVYNEVAYATVSPSTSGVLAVNRLNGGCQYMVLSENITDMSLSNFQSVFSIGSKTQFAFDTVTLLINANGYSLSLPATLSSSEAAKYANGTAAGPASTGDYFVVLTNTPLGVYITISPVFS